MTSMPGSRSARAITLAPRSWPSSPGLAITTLIFELIFLIAWGPTFIYRGGTPPPPLLLGAYAPRNGSRLSRGDASRRGLRRTEQNAAKPQQPAPSNQQPATSNQQPATSP